MTDERPRRARSRWLLPATLAAGALAAFAASQPPERLAADPSPSDAAVEDVEPAASVGAARHDRLRPPAAGGVPSPHPVPDRAANATADRSSHPAGDRAPTPTSASDVAAPTSVRIPAIDVDVELVELGLRDDGAMGVPEFGDAGWYARGPKPGEDGGAVIAAHYDSTSGPDVFYDLADLQPGDEVFVRAADDRTGVWRVVGAEQTPKDELPAERIWPDHAATPRLTLITCGGVFDRDVGHYTHNEVVYAEWVGWREA